MTLRILICILFAFIFAALPAGAESQPASRHGIVTWIYDGDTLEVEPHGKVRLLGIDTPEREASARDNILAKQGVSSSRQREIYQAAKIFMIENVKGREIQLISEEPQRDRHGRLLAYVLLADGSNLNRILLEKGLAVVYRKFSFNLKHDFLAAEEAARAARHGLWSRREGK